MNDRDVAFELMMLHGTCAEIAKKRRLWRTYAYLKHLSQSMAYHFQSLDGESA